MAEIIYDLTTIFTEKYIPKGSRTKDQMDQAGRSGKQNIAEAIELKLLQISRGSLEELLLDFEDFLRQRNLPLWSKEDSRAKKIRSLAYLSNKSYTTYMTYMSDPESAANCLICLIHQANFLLDQQLRSLEKEFLEKGGFTERMYSARKTHKSNMTYRSNKTYK